MSTLRRHTEPVVCRIASAIARYIGFGSDDHPVPTINPKHLTSEVKVQMNRSSLRLMASPDPLVQQSGHKWQRHAQLRAYEAPISTDVRTSRREAVRGLFAAREGAVDVATEHFAIAALCEEVDLTAVPGFWDLSRGEMQAAVNAYESVGRFRDAAALDAQIATIFRPTLVGVRLKPIIPRKPRHKAVST